MGDHAGQWKRRSNRRSTGTKTTRATGDLEMRSFAILHAMQRRRPFIDGDRKGFLNRRQTVAARGPLRRSAHCLVENVARAASGMTMAMHRPTPRGHTLIFFCSKKSRSPSSLRSRRIYWLEPKPVSLLFSKISRRKHFSHRGHEKDSDRGARHKARMMIIG